MMTLSIAWYGYCVAEKTLAMMHVTRLKKVRDATESILRSDRKRDAMKNNVKLNVQTVGDFVTVDRRFVTIDAEFDTAKNRLDYLNGVVVQAEALKNAVSRQITVKDSKANSDARQRGMETRPLGTRGVIRQSGDNVLPPRGRHVR
jgi:hypothetical protein